MVRGLRGEGKSKGNGPAWNSNFLLRMFMPNLTTVSNGARTSENRMKPMMIGNSLWKPKDS